MIKAKAELESKKYGFDQQAFKWLTEGETGSSSMAILHNTFNGGDKKQRSHPYDTGDFRRCRLLLEQVDHARESFNTMANVSMAWSNLVAHWSEVCDVMDEESPLWRQKSGSAKKANDLIRELVSAY